MAVTFTPGDKSPEDLVSEVDEGLMVYQVQGAHSSNPESGDFSVVATPAWKIEKGSVAHAVEGARLAGVIFDALSNVSAPGDNPRKMVTWLHPGSAWKTSKSLGDNLLFFIVWHS